MKFILLVALSVSFFASNLFSASALDFSGLKAIQVQDGGRVKPFDSFARESLQLIYGKQKMTDKEAVEIVFTWMLLPDYWANIDLIKIDYPKLKSDLDLDVNKKYFSPAVLISHPRLPALFQTLNSKTEDQERLNSYDRALQVLSNQLSLFQSVGQGLYPGFLPAAEGSKWRPVRDFSEEESNKFGQITKSFVDLLKSENVAEKKAALQSAVTEFKALNTDKSNKYIELEVFYNSFHPFQWAWIFYLLSSILLFVFWLTDRKLFYQAAVGLILIAFSIHSFGFIVRILLTGRPPVSNMYETVVWVPWGAVLFALFLEWSKKSQFMLLASNIVAILCLIVADMAPGVLDASLQPLEPVLRSNLWLTVHVLTIVLSYGAFFLAFILADIAMGLVLFNEKKFSDKINEITQAVYRAEKVGVVLLAAGTILGGVWADYSWGRFWGWDPKETWAFIALLGYLALLHAKHGGYIKRLGMLAGSIVAFSLVIMAWYGVNYVLGAGLHSYGFGAGGLEQVAGFVGIHILFVVFVLASRRK